MQRIFAKVVGCGEVRTASLIFLNHYKLLLMRFAPLTTSYVLSLNGGTAPPTTFATPSLAGEGRGEGDLITDELAKLLNQNEMLCKIFMAIYFY
jgi:hypothetical protein